MSPHDKQQSSVEGITDGVKHIQTPSPSKPASKKDGVKHIQSPSPSKPPPPKKTKGGAKEDSKTTAVVAEGDSKMPPDDYDDAGPLNEMEEEEDKFDDDENLNATIEEGVDKVQGKHPILTDLKNLADDLQKYNLFLFPRSDLQDDIDIECCHNLSESKRSELLYTIVKVDDDDDGKLLVLKLLGATTNGELRAGYLDKQYNTSDDDNDIHYLIVLNLNHMNKNANDHVVKTIESICERYCTFDKEQLQKMTVKEAEDMQAEKGIPFTFLLFLHYIHHHKAFKVYGVFKRVALHFLESGLQELMTDSSNDFGLELHEHAMKSVQHEFLRGECYLKKAVQRIKTIAKALNELLNVLAERYDEEFVKYLRTKIIIMKILSSWAPDIACYSFTNAILDVMVGIDNWWNAYLNEHPVKRGEGDVYDDSQFSDAQHEVARKTFSDFIAARSNPGNISAVDMNARLFLHIGGNAESFLKRQGWERITDLFDIADVIVYGYQPNDKELPAIIFLHQATCPIVNSDPKVPANEAWHERSDRAASTAGVLDQFALFLRTENPPDKMFSTDMQDYPVQKNILVMRALIEYLVRDVHLYRYAISNIVKHFRAGDAMGIDMFSAPHSNLILQYPHALSKDTGRYIDFHVVDRLRCIMSSNKGRDEMIALAVKALQGERDEERRELSVQDEILTNATRKIVFNDESLVEDIKAAVKNEEEEKRGNDKDRRDQAFRKSERSYSNKLKNKFAKFPGR